MQNERNQRQKTDQQADNLHRNARPELRGDGNVKRHADGSPREITLTVDYGSYGDRDPSRSDTEFSYGIDNKGTACIRYVAFLRAASSTYEQKNHP
jgi:hypothetical protein